MRIHIERSGAESVYGYYMEQMMGGVGGKNVGQDSGLTNSLLKSGQHMILTSLMYVLYMHILFTYLMAYTHSISYTLYTYLTSYIIYVHIFIHIPHRQEQ